MATMTLNKTVYTVGEKITVTISGMTARDEVFRIGLY